MKNIPFSPPRIDQKSIDAVTEVLRSGWITTGPKTRELEARINAYCSAQRTLCLNSWTNAAELVLRWFDIGPGDEVIIPAYTYAATANIVMHLGATPVLVDIERNGYLIDIAALERAITANTKAIMPVDIGGMPVDYDKIMTLLKSDKIKSLFQSKSKNQELLGRPLFIADAAHSFGALYKGKKVGSECDVAGFSFHAVKNLTTAEGGAICLNLPEPFDNHQIWKELNISALHGQTKDALSKTQAGQWRYDIVEAGYKCNLTDIHAALGLVEMDRYDSETLPRRKAICDYYTRVLEGNPWFIAPQFQTAISESSYHLYMLQLNNFTEEMRDKVISIVAEKGISTNVHFQPLPLLSFYKQKGYDMSHYPNAWNNYANEISLPVYFDLSDEEVELVAQSIISAVNEVLIGI
jgi:dTDP-4-amino-4,6-dideoxygalactose transaminase